MALIKEYETPSFPASFGRSGNSNIGHGDIIAHTTSNSRISSPRSTPYIFERPFTPKLARKHFEPQVQAEPSIQSVRIIKQTGLDSPRKKESVKILPERSPQSPRIQSVKIVKDRSPSSPRTQSVKLIGQPNKSSFSFAQL